jgi:hypothetical protein
MFAAPQFVDEPINVRQTPGQAKLNSDSHRSAAALQLTEQPLPGFAICRFQQPLTAGKYVQSAIVFV